MGFVADRVTMGQPPVRHSFVADGRIADTASIHHKKVEKSQGFDARSEGYVS